MKDGHYGNDTGRLAKLPGEAYARAFKSLQKRSNPKCSRVLSGDPDWGGSYVPVADTSANLNVGNRRVNDTYGGDEE